MVARPRALLSRASSFAAAALLGLVALAACADLKEASAPADHEEGGADGGPGSSGDADASTRPGTEGGSSEAGAGNGDPRWPQGPLPADVPPNASYMLTNGADGAIVKDTVTGLSWQDAVPSQNLTFDAAKAYCDGLVYDGQSDWRLPTRIEATGIMVFKPVFGESAVAGPAFSSVSGAQCFWTASPFARSTNTAYSVTTAAVGFELTDSKCAARCVRGGPALGAPVTKQFIVGVDTVTDPTTGLVWEKTPPVTEAMFDVAEARCKALVLGGKTMRLPGVKELASIVDETKSGPAASGVFGDYAARMFTANVRWTLDFDNGTLSQSATGFAYWSRCVSGP